MPQTTETAQALYQIEIEAENTICAYALASESEDENDYEEDLEDLLTLREVIASDRYLLSRNTGAGRRHDIDLLEAYIQDYPNTAFLSLFRMHRASFWQVVEVLTLAGGEGYWVQSKTGRPPRPIYQQVAVALYVVEVPEKELALH
ncbi:hypothetical protein L211DRAFT_854165 [Terfezia boudieri ATCC MYA-4762]|uniref:Uncharacterized protein n=1 Tax=Terfezia boudieri ATCC MYA-4762 TaxID=1051890 RepID=A0A3N4L663_9PEZI|nr:hypothetical protein L211DRAFT_854165 [Terfezia boudieri ATCC MYA-4762]